MTRTAMFLTFALLISLSTQFATGEAPQTHHVPTIEQVLR